jgi:hypothetical protein
MHVTIIGRPAGEAPDWVRDAWIGLRLPLARPRARAWQGVGVLSGPTGFFRQTWAILRGQTTRTRGYLVNAKLAVDLLAGANPAAAAWWHENGPEWLTGHKGFIFDEAACRPDPD